MLQTFFEKFDLVADAPGAVAKMRELVLELAVQGRLVPQHAKDETAHALLERVASTAKTRRQGPDQWEDIDAPFPIPETWAWVRLPRVLKKLTDGTHHSPPNGPSGDFMYVTAKNIKTDGVLLDGITYVSKEVHDEIYSRCDPNFGDVLYIKDGATTGIATINQVKEPFSMLSSVALLKPSEAIFNRYLLWAMRSPFFYAETRGSMKGAAITRVTLSVMAASLLPLPPLAEQKRIVAKVDELMALCDRLEAQQQERETRHAALARASLARFADAPTPANLPFLFHPSYAIPPADLRKSILTLAVQGKLVPQDPNDELSDSIPEIIPSSPPLDVPSSWRWTEFGEIGEISGGFAFKSGDYTPSGVFILRVTNIAPSGVISKDEAVFLPPEKVTREVERFYLNEGDILLVMVGGSLGKIGLVTSDILPALLNQNLWRITPVNGEVDSQFLRLITDFAVSFQRQITHSTHGHLSREEFRKKSVAFPPLAEQRRIVAKVEQLMALVDALETQLAASRATAAKLLSALVAELTSAPTTAMPQQKAA